ncbi:PepSY domain-containing protein [Candidatus Saccharibacteria bacterium]|nr:PepSY domain-containing protein [Candidatus Saccharibacteria bacterium]
MVKAKTKNTAEMRTESLKIILNAGLIVIGLEIVVILVIVLAKTLRNEQISKQYTISYHSDDKLAEQIIEQSELDGDLIIDDETIIRPEEYIAIEKALAIALENVGANRDSVWDIDIELERKFGQVVYEVSFNYEKYEYEYYINAKSGEIIKSFKEID